MDIVLLILSMVLAGMGAYLAGDFMLWKVKGQVINAVITGFQARRNKGLQLPVVSFEKEKGQMQAAKAERIDGFLYLFDRPIENQTIKIIYRTAQPERARVYGMINVIAAGFLSAPLLITLALKLGNMQAVGQLAYLLQFGVIVIGGWVVLKLIQRNY